MSCGAETEAAALLANLTANDSLLVPNIDISGPLYQIPAGLTDKLYGKIASLSNSDLTTGVGGTGTFDMLMTSLGAHLRTEYEKGRITGSEYTRAYIELTQSAMGNAVQFLLGRDQAFWEAQKSQIAAITARVQLEATRVALVEARSSALLAKASYALGTMKLASESMAYCTGKYNLEYIMPQQRQAAEYDQGIKGYTLTQILPEQLESSQLQRRIGEVEKTTKDFIFANMLPEQLAAAKEQLLMAQAQRSGAQLDTSIKSYTLSDLMPKQRELLMSQIDTQRGQVRNSLSDGAEVEGVIGVQRNLYGQQIRSYERDAEIKMVRIFTEAWTAMKAVDEGLTPPAQFNNGNLDAMLGQLRARNNMNG